VHFVAIVERRLLDWYIYIPVLGSGGSATELTAVQTCATALATAATGLAPADLQISVHRVLQADTLLPVAPMDVQIQHTDGTWRAAQHIGWVRPRDGGWNPLVCYVADGTTWERAVHPSRFRQPAPDVSAVPSRA
jgi:hypothetical protein